MDVGVGGSGVGGGSSSGSINSASGGSGPNRRQILTSRYSLIKEGEKGGEMKGVRGVEATESLAAATTEVGTCGEGAEKAKRQSEQHQQHHEGEKLPVAQSQMNRSDNSETLAAPCTPDNNEEGSSKKSDGIVKESWTMVTRSTSISPSSSSTTTSALAEKELGDSSNISSCAIPSSQSQQKPQSQNEEDTKITERALDFTASTQEKINRDDLISRPPPPSPDDFAP
eukprot:451855-Ditylum_brightwellii.AAC.1